MVAEAQQAPTPIPIKGLAVGRTSIHHDPDEKQPGTWHFPEYVT